MQITHPQARYCPFLDTESAVNFKLPSSVSLFKHRRLFTLQTKTSPTSARQARKALHSQPGSLRGIKQKIQHSGKHIRQDYNQM